MKAQVVPQIEHALGISTDNSNGKAETRIIGPNLHKKELH